MSAIRAGRPATAAALPDNAGSAVLALGFESGIPEGRSARDDMAESGSGAMQKAEQAQARQSSGLQSNPVFADTQHTSQQATTSHHPTQNHAISWHFHLRRSPIAVFLVTFFPESFENFISNIIETWLLLALHRCTFEAGQYRLIQLEAYACCAVQAVESLVSKEAVPCIFIQDNPTFDALRSSLGLRPSAPSTDGHSSSSQQHSLQVGHAPFSSNRL